MPPPQYPRAGKCIKVSGWGDQMNQAQIRLDNLLLAPRIHASAQQRSSLSSPERHVLMLDVDSQDQSYTRAEVLTVISIVSVCLFIMQILRYPRLCIFCLDSGRQAYDGRECVRGTERGI